MKYEEIKVVGQQFDPILIETRENELTAVAEERR